MEKNSRLRGAFLALAALRVVVGVLAIPLAPFLYREHFIVLVLMRPTKEVLLAGGFLVRLGKVGLIPLLIAATPLAILGVWQFYYLGRQYAGHIRTGRVPKLARRVLPAAKIRTMAKLLDRKGERLILFGRLAAFPSALVGAAAGAADMPSRRFLPIDLIGGLLSIAEVVAAGWGLGYAYRRAGPWITIAGVAFLVVVAVIVARFLRRA